MSIVTALRSFDAPDFIRGEILRYMGVVGEASEEVSELIDSCTLECADRLIYRTCFAEVPIAVERESVALPFAKWQSRDLCRALQSCDAVILFAATLGIEIDRLITKYSRISPARALCLQAIGAERIESLCNLLCKTLKEEYAQRGFSLCPRFSPGYGDLSLCVQNDIFCLLDCTKRLGISLNESLLMSPSKSVTAIIGIKKDV